MVTELHNRTVDTIDTAFEQYVRRTMPDALRDESVPPTWTADEKTWRQWREEALEFFRARARYEFVIAIAGQGMYPDEAATGQLRAGALVDGTNKVVRPQPPASTREQIEEAAELLRLIDQTMAPINVIFRADLERVSIGAWHGDERRVGLVLAEARSAVRSRQAEIAAGRDGLRARPWIEAKIPFTWKGGKTFAAGQQQLDPAELADLLDWKSKMEAQRALHQQDAPVGFSAENWPPFVVIPER